MSLTGITQSEEKTGDDEPPDHLKLERLVSIKEISKISDLSMREIKEICDKYPVRIPRYYFSLIKEKDDGIYKQCIPSKDEISDEFGKEDPLNEDQGHLNGKFPSVITHKYPDRVLLLISNQCSMYCRFCTRKRKVGDPKKQKTWREIKEGIEYIENHPEIRDVLLSGGDPLMLSNQNLERIVKEVREIPHVEIIRIGTRIPCTFPQRVDQELCNILKKYHPLYMNIHFNHPDEITPESAKACAMLADAGIPLGSQTVLLKGVNDNPETMKKLMQKAVSIRVKPYYLYQCDPVKGASHFITRAEKGLEAIEAIRGHTSGLCQPDFVIDTAGGKIPLIPKYLVSINGEKVVMRNYEGKEFEYMQVK